MALNKVQRDFVNGAARPYIATFLRSDHDDAVFVADYDAIQGGIDALPEDAIVLNDNEAGDGPRADAPQITGAQVKVLRDLAAARVAVLNEVTRTTLISKLIRSLADVLGLR